MPRIAASLLTLILCFPTANLLAQRRIRGPVENGRRVRLSGHINPLARAENDIGPIDGAEILSSITLRFRQTAAQQAELEALLARQQDPASPDYHRWLTPEEYGQRFGLSQDDLATVTGWLTQQNLQVTSVAPSRTSVSFQGTAADVEKALGAEVHRYLVNGRRHFSNADEPSLPLAIDAVVAAIQGLNDFGLRPRSKAQPKYTSNSGRNYLSPTDLATIYNFQPLHDAGFTGAGQKIVIPGQTRLPLDDWQKFRTRFGLPANNDPELILMPGSRDPGVSSDDLGEANLDIQWAGAVAPDAKIIYVYSNDVLDSLQYAVEQNLAPVISLSYGLCEPNISRSSALSLQFIARQANAQGITWFSASGDSGGADCLNGTSTNGGGLAVDIPASIPEVTGVGGTEFAPDGRTYWNAANGPTGGSALSYIPETTWNNSTPADPASGGGGTSTIFAKPAWQIGPGVPENTARNLPDVALTSSAQNTGYLVYNQGELQPFGGTSAASPAMAGIFTLLNQYLISTGAQSAPGLGNVNPKLYSLAQSTSGVFHDVVTGDNIVTVTCGTRSRNCTPGDHGYNAGPGYDRATGLGSVDANALVTAWRNQIVPSDRVTDPPVISGVTNGASFQQAFAPGMVVSIFGSNLAPLSFIAGSTPLPMAISGVTVTFNGLNAPLYYVSPGQLNVQIPYEAPVGRNVLTLSNNSRSVTATLDVKAAAPGIFTGQGGTVVPVSTARRGQVIEMYVTGVGALSPAIATGAAPSANTAVASLPKPTVLPEVTIGGVPATIEFAGNPVGLVGVTQMNVRVPASAGLGTQSVVVTVAGNASAPATLTISQ